MSIDLKYGTIFGTSDKDNYAINDAEGIEPIGHEDEPLMVFRAQDKLSVPLLARYENLYVATQPDGFNPDTDPFVIGVREARAAFEEWQRSNADKVKLPD